METQFLDRLAKKFTWKIPGFSKLVEDKHYSQTFSIDGGDWRILMYPKGNQTDHLSLYLHVPEAATMPQGWKQTASFSFILVNQLIGDNSKILGAQTEYTADSIYWGFNEFMPLSELQDPSNGFLVNDTLIVEVKFEPKLTGEFVVTPTKLSWEITNFPSLTEKYNYSPACKIGHGNWKLLIFPIRDESQQTQLSLYLEVANQATLPKEWNMNAKFKLVIVNQNDNSKSIIEDIQNEFKWGDMRRGFLSSAELHDGFIVNNTLIVEADFVPDEVEPTGEQLLELRNFTWKITNFTKLNAEKYYSQIFTIDGNRWTIVMYPKGNETNNLSLFLNVPDSARLPRGWKRSAHFSLIVVNQNAGGNDYQRGGEGAPVEFNERKIERGYRDFLPLGMLQEPSNGFLVNDTLIVKVKFESELLGEHTVNSKNFKWTIKNFPSLTAKYYTSPTFEIEGIKWRLQIFPHGNGNARSHLSLYLHVMNFEAFPEGWTIDATYKLLIVNQVNHLRSTITEEKNEFRAGIVSWGEQFMISSSELLNSAAGFIVNNALIVQAQFIHLKIEPTTATFHSYFSSLGKFISEAEDLTSVIGSSSYNRNELVLYATPSSDDIVKAKQSLKECLSDLFKLNMKERLAQALLILSRAESGLTEDQKRSITTFREGFNEFTYDFLAFELANSEFELLKVQKDRVLGDMKMTQETHCSIKTKTDELAKRREIIQTRLQEIEFEKERIKSELEVLVIESVEAKYKYEIQEKKVAEVVEKKRFSEQRMSRSTAAWANMKAQFA